MRKLGQRRTRFPVTAVRALTSPRVCATRSYNAADACEKLNITADELDTKWSKLTRNTNLLKFGGGFYCGQVDGIFVMNGCA